MIRSCRVCKIKGSKENTQHWHKSCCSMKCFKMMKALRRNHFKYAVLRNKRSIKNNPVIIVNKSKKSNEFYSSKDWLVLRYEAFKKYGQSCALCGRNKVKDGVTIHVDHIKPKSKFPELALSLSNLQILCSDCNLGKSNRHFDDWRIV